MLPESQLATAVLMVRPARFGFNPETALTNAFQADDQSLDPTEVQARALVEFDGFVDRLRAADVTVVVLADPGAPPTPDSIFPNNWVSFHPGGRVVLYPMQAPSRRAERRPAFLDALRRDYGLRLTDILDLSPFEAQNQFLEGTGSLILDRVHRVAYACRSARTHPTVVAAFCAALGYEALLFDATDAAGVPIYHTNVMLSVGADLAIACLDALPHPAEAKALRTQLEATGKAVLAISRVQVAQFAGNMLQVRTRAGAPLLVLSQTAHDALTPDQRSFLAARTALLPVALPTIERYGGGSARCMLAELFADNSAL